MSMGVTPVTLYIAHQTRLYHKGQQEAPFLEACAHVLIITMLKAMCCGMRWVIKGH